MRYKQRYNINVRGKNITIKDLTTFRDNAKVKFNNNEPLHLTLTIVH